MKKMHFLPVIMMFLMVFCKDDVSVTPSTNLIGAWDWTASTGGLAGVHQTPQNSGRSGQIIFSSDSTFKTFWSDTLTSSGKFRVYSGVLPGNGPAVQTLIIFSNYLAPEILTVKGDLLTIDPGCCDQFATTWKRHEVSVLNPG